MDEIILIEPQKKYVDEVCRVFVAVWGQGK